MYRQEWVYNEEQGIGRDGTRENQMEEVHMKIVHIKTIGEGRGEGWENRCQRDRKGGNDGSHLNVYGKNVRNTYQFYFLKYLKK